MALWFDEIYDDHTRYGLRVERTLYSAQSDFQRIDIFDTVAMGRALALDGVFMTSEGDEHFYHEMLVHPALCAHPQPERVLVIGGGDGGTVREVLRHRDVKQVTMVEIDRQVVEACQAHLTTIGTAWEDPRLQVRFEDGVAFVRGAPSGAFDVVILDGSDPVGPAEGLVDLSFYRDCGRVLRDGGALALQSQSPSVQLELFRRIQHRLGGVFEQVHPYLGCVPIYSAGLWSFTWAAPSGQPQAVLPERVHAIEPACRYYNRDIHEAAFALPSFIARAIQSRR